MLSPGGKEKCWNCNAVPAGWKILNTAIQVFLSQENQQLRTVLRLYLCREAVNQCRGPLWQRDDVPTSLVPAAARRAD